MVAFVIESWIWYGFAMTVVILRYIARIWHFKGIQRLQFEDWFMLFVACVYTVLIVTLNICYGTSSNLIDPADIPTLTPEDIAERVYGSKIILVVEQCMCAVQWGTKACLLILYWRLTQNIVQAWLIKGTAIYVAGTYIIMEVLYFAVWCRPFHDYWQTPTDNVQCTTALHHLIVNLVFNLTSDLLILSIPWPIIARAHLGPRKKLLLALPFSLGFFSIICAILSKHLSFTQPFSAEWNYWYCREASTIMIVSNLPYTWSLLRRIFKLRSFFGGSGETAGNTYPDAKTRGTDAEMAGEVPEIHGLPMDSMSSGTNTTGTLSKDKIGGGDSRGEKVFSFSSWSSKPQEVGALESSGSSHHDKNVPIFSQSVTGRPEDSDQHEIDGRSDPLGDDSSYGVTRAQRLSSCETNELRRESSRVVSAMDRLYRLDDDDLLADEQQAQKRSEVREPR